MNREEMIELEGNQILRPVLHQSMEELMKNYKKHETEITDSLMSALKQLYQMASRMQKQGERGTLAYLGIFYCLSSVYTENYELRIELYDEDFCLDEVECSVGWKPDFVISYLLDDIAYFRKKIRKKIPRIRTCEEQQFIMGYMKNYMYILYEFLRQKLPEVIASVPVDDIKIEEEFHIFFGEYMGRFTELGKEYRREQA